MWAFAAEMGKAFTDAEESMIDDCYPNNPADLWSDYEWVESIDRFVDAVREHIQQHNSPPTRSDLDDMVRLIPQ
jgi:hypothetical protein